MISLKCSCDTCKNYIGNSTCKAFPEKIPDEIISGIEDHTTPYPGDNGIQFENKEEEK